MNIVAYDLIGHSILCDYIIVCSANSTTHLNAIKSNVSKVVKDELKLLPRSTEGQAESGWVVLDYNDIVIHVFHQECRGDYRFDEIFSECDCIYSMPEEESIR